MESKVILTDVWMWFNHGFEAAMIDSELIPDHFRRQYGKDVAKLRRQIASDWDPAFHPCYVDHLPYDTPIEKKAQHLFAKLKQLRTKLITDHIEKYV